MVKNNTKGACKISNDIQKKRDEFNKELEKLNNNIKAKLNSGVDTGKKVISDTVEAPSRGLNKLRYLMSYYWKRRYGSKLADRPDLVFVYDILLGGVILFLLHQLIFRIVPLLKPSFIPPKILAFLNKLPESRIDPNKLMKAKVKQHSIKSHDSYFRLQPFGTITESDKVAMQYAQIMMQLCINLFIFVVIPFVVIYIIWLFAKYTPTMKNASIGLFKTMFRFFYRLVKSAASKKWVIRTVMGWGKVKGPKLGKEHIIPWKRRYIDQWVDRETLKYRILYYKVREKYYYQPKRKYIEIPWANLKRKLIEFKRIYIDLTYKEFWTLVINTYPEFVTKPENELYRQLYGLDALRNKYYMELNDKIAETRINSSKQVSKCLGTDYDSITRVSGKPCTCKVGGPHEKDCGKVAVVAQAAIKTTEKLNEEITGPIGDTIGKGLDAATNCNSYNNLGSNIADKTKLFVSKIPVIIFWLIIILVALLICLIVYCKIFGVPRWLLPFVSPEIKMAFISGDKIPVRKNKLLASILGLN